MVRHHFGVRSLVQTQAYTSVHGLLNELAEQRGNDDAL